MCREDWELASWVATALASVLGAIGFAVLIWQLNLQRKQSRLEFLNRLYDEFDSAGARSARGYVYSAPASQLRLDYLHEKGREAERAMVEDTLAMLERTSYRIVENHVPSDDAFKVYAGVLLSLAHRLWP